MITKIAMIVAYDVNQLDLTDRHWSLVINSSLTTRTSSSLPQTTAADRLNE